MHMHMLAARWAYHRTDPQGMGSKWSQHCGPPMTVYIWRLGTKNRGHIGGLHGWSSALGRRLRVQAPGRCSFSPVATFKPCSWQTWTCYTPACITLTDNVYVSYGHLACGLEIISVAIPMASTCSIHLYNGLNSWFRLLPILRCSCGSQFSDRLRQVSVPFSVPVKIPLVHGDAGQNGVCYPYKGLGMWGKGIGVWKPFDCAIARCPHLAPLVVAITNVCTIGVATWDYLPLPQSIGIDTLYLYQIWIKDGNVNEYSNVCRMFDAKVLLNCWPLISCANSATCKSCNSWQKTSNMFGFLCTVSMTSWRMNPFFSARMWQSLPTRSKVLAVIKWCLNNAGTFSSRGSWMSLS